MKNFSKNIFTLLATASLLISGCEQKDYTLGELVTPSNLVLDYTITGATDSLPYGDGSGEVIFMGGADNAINLTFDFGDGKNKEIAPPDDSVKHIFSTTGIVSYNVTMTAVGRGGLLSSTTETIEVFSSFEDDVAVTYLTGDSAKKWYWAADVGGHLGLGPNSVSEDGYTWAAWYNAAPFEKTCMYEAEFLFTKTADGVTFEQTTGPAFIPGTYAGKIGVEADACYGEDIVPSLYGVKNVSFGPAQSIATEEGGYRGTTMSFSDGGIMCLYVGKSEFEIISITENTLQVRIEEDDTYAWYQTLTSTKPVE